MARKFGKKNIVNLDPLAYNTMLIGESGIGKTTVIKEFCEKLAGEDGYIFLNTGKEDGYMAIQGLQYEEIRDYAGYVEVINDIIENRFTDYADLKVVVIDTYDELVPLAEKESIRLHNKAHPDKRVDSIKAAWGSFGKGEDKAIDLILDPLWALKDVGVHFIIIGHTKKKDIDDAVTGISYTTLTNNLSQKYFNAIKTKVQFLGVAYIDREIVKEKTGKKNIVNGKEEIRGVIKNESRVIRFRDDTYSVDSKSRFSDIVDCIPLDSDALITAIKDAIYAEYVKGGKTVEQGKTEQAASDAAAEKIQKELSASAKAKRSAEEEAEKRAELFNLIQTTFPDASEENKTAAKKILVENGCKKFSDEGLSVEAMELIAKTLKG